MANNLTEIISIDFDNEKLIKGLNEAEKSIQKYSDEIKLLNKTKKENGTLSDSQIQKLTDLKLKQKEATQERSKVQKVLLETSKAKKILLSDDKNEIKTRRQLNEENKSLRKLKNELSDSGKGESKTAKKLNAIIEKNTRLIALNNDETEERVSGIGNYKEAIKSSLGELSVFGRVQAQINAISAPFKGILNKQKDGLRENSKAIKFATGSLNGMSIAQKVSVVSSNLLSGALRILRVALISTGIGAIVVLLGSLVAWFTKTQKGSEFVARAMARVGAVIDVIVDRFSKFGGAIMGFITGTKSANESFGEMKESIKGVGDEMEREIHLAGKLAQKSEELRKKEALANVGRSAKKAQMKKLNKIAEDTTKSAEDRIKALEEHSKLEEQLAQKDLGIAEEKLAIQLGVLELGEKERELLKQIEEGSISANEVLSKLGISESQTEDLQEFTDILKEMYDKRAEVDEIGTTRQNKENTIRQQGTAQEKKAIDDINKKREKAHKEAIERAKKRVDMALKEQQISLDTFKAKNENENGSLEEQLSYFESVLKKEKDLLKLNLTNKKILRSEYNLVTIELEKEHLKNLNELVFENLSKELEFYKLKNKSKLEEGARFNEEYKDNELKRLEDLEKKEADLLRLQLDKNLISKQDFDLQKLQLEQDYLEKRNGLNDKYDNQLLQDQKTKEAEEYQRRILELEINQATELERKLFALDNEYLLKEEKYRTHLESGLITKQEFDGLSNQLQEEQVQSESELRLKTKAEQIGEFAGLMGSLSSLAGKNSELGKKFAIAEVIMSTQRGIMSAWADAKSTLTQKIVQTALVTAQGLKSLSTIRKTRTPRAEKGGVFTFGGKRHNQGGNTLYDEQGMPVLETEQGESTLVLNRNSSGLLNNLSLLNQLGGGVAFGSPSSNTSITNNNTTNNIDVNELSEAVILGLKGYGEEVANGVDSSY